MKAHVVFVKELNRKFPVLAPNIFDAAIFVLGEQRPSWIEAECRVEADGELFSFRAKKFGDKVEFEFGSGSDVERAIK